MRITVALILNLVANGIREQEILADYPYLESADIRQALAYAAWLVNKSTPQVLTSIRSQRQVCSS